MGPIPVVVASTGGGFVEQLRDPRAPVLVLREAADAVELHSCVAVLRPRAVLIEVGFPGLTSTELASLAQLGCRCLAVGSPQDSRHQDLARQWGIELTDGSPARLAAVLAAPERERPRVGSTGRVIAVSGPPGSPGVSTVAANLAAELPGPSILVDADPSAASQAFIFGARAEPSGLLAALARSRAGVIDRDSWRDCLVEVGSQVLLATGTADAAALSGFAEGLLPVADASRGTAASTVLDCGSGELPEWGARAVAEADAVAVVAAPTALGIHRLARWWTLHRPVLSGMVVLVWNRVGGSGTSALGSDPVARLQEASALAGAGIGFAVLPEDDEAAVAMNRRPGPLAEVAPDSRLRGAVRELALRFDYG